MAHAAPASPAAWCAGPATATDRPDARGGDTIHAIYAAPSDSTDRFAQLAELIRNDVDAVDGWWSQQDSTRQPRWDVVAPTATCKGSGTLDISDVQLPHPTSYYQPTANRLTRIRDDLVAAGFADPAKKYLVYYDQATSITTSECGTAIVNAQEGGSHGYAAVYMAPNLAKAPLTRGCGSIEPPVIMAHELVNELGALDSTSTPGPPHKCPGDSLHPCDNSLDVLTPTPSATTIGAAALDYNHDDYYAHSGSWWDVQDSPWLQHRDAPEHNLKLTVTKGAENVTVTGQQTLTCAAGTTCRWTWPAGASVALAATAATGYSLIGWKGCDTTDGATCTVALTRARAVVATFAPPLHATSFHVQFTKRGPLRLTATLHLNQGTQADIVGCSFGAQPVMGSRIRFGVARCTWAVPGSFRGHRIRGSVDINFNGQTLLTKPFRVLVPPR